MRQKTAISEARDPPEVGKEKLTDSGWLAPLKRHVDYDSHLLSVCHWVP